MNNAKRLDRVIVRLVYVRNLLTRHGHEVDFDLDPHEVEAAVSTLYESALTQVEDLNHDNPRD